LEEPHAYWAPGYDPVVSVETIAETYNVKASIFKRCFRGDDMFLKPTAASAVIEIAPRTFRAHKYTPTLKKHRIVRYSRVSLLDEFRRREEERKTPLKKRK